MAVGDHLDFEFVGGPHDGEVLPVADQGRGYPDILGVPHIYDEEKAKRAGQPPPGEWHRYERDGRTYRYLGPANDEQE